METLKISLNKPIYEFEDLDINWNLCKENNGVLSVVLNNDAGYSLRVGDYIRFERTVVIENENSYVNELPEGFKESTIESIVFKDCEILSIESKSKFTVEVPKRDDLYLDLNASGEFESGKYLLTFNDIHNFFYQDIEMADVSGNPITLTYSGYTFQFSATTTMGNYDGIPSSYTITHKAECGEDEDVPYKYFFLPTRESRNSIRADGNLTLEEGIPFICNQNVFYFVDTEGNVTPWTDSKYTNPPQTNTSVSKYVGYWNIAVPLEANNDYAHLYQEINIQDIYSEKIKKNVIPDVIDMEKVKYKPIINGDEIEIVSGLTFNLHFRQREGDDWHVIKSRGWNTSDDDLSDGLYLLGFTDNDVRYQKMKVQKSFIRLSFYRSGDSGDTFNPLNASLLYYSTVFFDSGELFGKFNKKRTEMIKRGERWEENEDSQRVLIESVSRNSIIRVDSQINIFNEFNTTKSSEGFNIYLFHDDAPENASETIYMKVEFNHAGFGRTIPMTKAGDSEITIDDYYKELYIPLKITHIDNEYFYSFDDDMTPYVVNDAEKRSITFNLYEPKIANGKNI